MKKIVSFFMVVSMLVSSIVFSPMYVKAAATPGKTFETAVEMEFVNERTYKLVNEKDASNGDLVATYSAHGRIEYEWDGLYYFDIDTTGTYDFTFKSKTDCKLYFGLYFGDESSKPVVSGSTNTAPDTQVMSYTLKPGKYYLALSAFANSDPKQVGTMKIKKQETKTPYLSKGSATLAVGKSLKLSLKNKPSGTITWASGKPEVATVNKKGKVTAKKAGTAYIYCIINNKVYKCKVKVK